VALWKRIKRAVSSNLERFRDDPLTPGDVRAFSGDLSTLRTQIQLLEADLSRLEVEEETLSELIRVALKSGRRSDGLDHAEVLARVRRDKTRIEGHLVGARRAVDRAEGIERDLRGEAQAKTQNRPTPTEPQQFEDQALDLRANATLERMERELNAPSERTDTGDKTLGDGGRPGHASGPTRVASKTLGGGSPTNAESDPATQGRKTLGGESPPQALDGAPKGGDLLGELERLGRLKEQGVLTDDEFAQAKKKLLGS
jgi:predicted nucleic acid-binding protein